MNITQYANYRTINPDCEKRKSGPSLSADIEIHDIFKSLHDNTVCPVAESYCLKYPVLINNWGRFCSSFWAFLATRTVPLHAEFRKSPNLLLSAALNFQFEFHPPFRDSAPGSEPYDYGMDELGYSKRGKRTKKKLNVSEKLKKHEGILLASVL